jgi:hypothetical protein
VNVSPVSAPPSGGLPGSGGTSMSSTFPFEYCPRTTTRGPPSRGVKTKTSWSGALTTVLSAIRCRAAPGKPVSMSTSPLPMTLPSGHASVPWAMSSASLASHSGTAEVSMTVPGASSTWTWLSGDGLPSGSSGLTKSVSTCRLALVPGSSLLNVSTYFATRGCSCAFAAPGNASAAAAMAAMTLPMKIPPPSYCHPDSTRARRY